MATALDVGGCARGRGGWSAGWLRYGVVEIWVVEIWGGRLGCMRWAERKAVGRYVVERGWRAAAMRAMEVEVCVGR